MNNTLTDLLSTIKIQYACQPTFHQVAKEILSSLSHHLEATNATAEDYSRVERLLEPERVVGFKIVWSDDQGNLQYNRGWRVQFSSALGPYKGGLRFDPSVNEDVLKFLAFEQVFKNALTGLPLGGGKGGSDFNPKGKTDNEIRTFSRAFMTQLHRHIGPDTDVPAGDIGVSGREIGYMFGAYKELQNKTDGALTGKPVVLGGSRVRTEATGYGVVYFAKAMLAYAHKELSGLQAVVSGAGVVAEHTVRKLIHENVEVLTMSDRSGYIYKKSGFSIGDVDMLMAHKANGNNFDSLKLEGIEFHAGTPWQVTADIYFPCATQNELGEKDAQALAAHAVAVVEGANMPLTTEAQEVIRNSKVLYGPSKAANAGGVAVSGLEMTQNATHTQWTSAQVDEQLQTIMQGIHTQCVEFGTQKDGQVDYVEGSNIAGGARVLEAMKLLGW